MMWKSYSPPAAALSLLNAVLDIRLSVSFPCDDSWRQRSVITLHLQLTDQHNCTLQIGADQRWPPAHRQ